MLKIEYFYKDQLASIIEISEQNVKVENFLDDRVLTAFGTNCNPTLDDFDEFLEDRCFPKNRHNCKQLLKYLDVDSYDPLQICYKTHGVIHGDYNWMRFDDQKDVTWEGTIKPSYSK